MVFNHCMIHLQALVAKDMDEELHNILHKTLLVQLTTLNATVLTAFQYFAMRWAQRMRDYCYTPKRQYEQLSQFERRRIIGTREAGWSARRVARQLGHSDCVARRRWDQWIR
ncbi:hypothetical protein TNCV_4450521 [Trichonephila clavipes]|nr:hypothetical protein TNCV_4450521 [Trichonephila clavipes]